MLIIYNVYKYTLLLNIFYRCKQNYFYTDESKIENVVIYILAHKHLSDS